MRPLQSMTARPQTFRALASILLAGGLLSFAATVGTAPDTSPARSQQVFVEAGRAYDAGRTADAIKSYRELLDKGMAPRELFFNLGNAYFKSGDMGRAILSYRRAWYHMPRDPDTLANTGFAQQQSGAAPAALARTTALLLTLQRGEWAAVAVVGYWGLALVIILRLLTRRFSRALVRAAICLLLVLLVGTAGILAWTDLLSWRPEGVIISGRQDVLFAPLEGATVRFALPEGSIVRILGSSGNWLKVASGREQGWLPASDCISVSAWRSY